MTDLITRLSKLDAPDREADAEIDRALGLHVDVGEFSGPWTRYPEPDHYRQTTPYTASMDAVIALAARELPRHRWSAGFSRHVPHNAQIWVPSGSGYYEGESDANRAIALLIALLRAKEASKP
ncbi:hypothetical protein CQ057_16755 [Ochrobactrum sp. MYb49]|nr:hypothetical protein CQ057_16755 [Ochrobactrum sp. MYb49]